MADGFIQLTTDGAGKKLDTSDINLGVGSTSLHRERMVIAGPTSSDGFASVTSSAGVLVQATGPVSVSGTVTVVTASSGLVQISGVPVVAVSSSALAPVNLVTSSGAYVPTTTGTGLLVQSTQTHPVTQSGTWNIVSASSGLVQISGTPTVLSASSGFVQVYQSTSPWAVVTASSGLVQIAGTPAITLQGSSGGTALVTTSGALSVTISTAAGSGSTAINIVGSSGAITPATSSGGLLVSISTGNIVTVLSASSGSTPTVLSASSGLIQMLGTVTTSTPEYAAGVQLVAMTTAGQLRVTGGGSSDVGIANWLGSTVPTVGQKAKASSIPVVTASDYIVSVLSASSGVTSIDQVYGASSGNLQVALMGSSGIQAIVTSSGALLVSASVSGTASTSVNVLGTQNAVVSVATSGTFAGALVVFSTAASGSGSTAVNIIGTSSAIGPVTTSGGQLVTAIQSSVYTVTATAATNPWSSAPGFNVPVVTVSSGLVQISGTPLVNVVGTSSGVAVVTTSGGLSVSVQNTVTVLSASSGLVQISGTPTVLSASSGLVQISGTATVVNASSGLVQISGTVGLSTAASGNLVNIVTSSAGSLVATTSQGLQVQQSTSKIVPVLQASSGVTSIDQTYGTTADGLRVVLSTFATIGGISAKFITVTSSGLKSLSTAASIIYGMMCYATMTTGAVIKNSYLQLFPQTCSGPTVGTTLPVMVIPIPLVLASAPQAQAYSGPTWMDLSEHGLVSSTGWSAAATVTTTGSTLTTDNTYVNVILSGT